MNKLQLYKAYNFSHMMGICRTHKIDLNSELLKRTGNNIVGNKSEQIKYRWFINQPHLLAVWFPLRSQQS